MSKSHSAAVATESGVVIPTLSARQILPWLVLAGLVLIVAVYFLSTEQGATSLVAGSAVHEWLHDGRHLLGYPCH